MKIAARQRFPELSEEEECREVGRGLNSTLLGKAVLTAMQLLGVRRSLQRIGTTFRQGNNYIQATVKVLAPTSIEVELGPLVGPSAYFEGVLEEGPRQMGAKTMQVTRTRTTGEHITWRVDWTE
ncbi:MAG: DUF2378 family protein [Myxococcaceae bacterium]|nr:DUF2378 family protein [Myxococcaceae bacterium]